MYVCVHIRLTRYPPVCLAVKISVHVRVCACVCVCKHFKDALMVSCAYTHLITFGLLQQNKALISLLIKTSLAKVNDWETGTVGCVCVCVCVCVCLCVCINMSVCMFSFLCLSPLGRH